MEYFLGFIVFVLVICLSSCKNPDPNFKRLEHCNGRMSKLNYGEHTYIGWSLNAGCGLVHDPDCQCQKGERK